MLYLTLLRVYGLPILWSGLKALAVIAALMAGHVIYHFAMGTDPWILTFFEQLKN